MMLEVNYTPAAAKSRIREYSWAQQLDSCRRNDGVGATRVVALPPAGRMGGLRLAAPPLMRSPGALTRKGATTRVAPTTAMLEDTACARPSNVMPLVDAPAP